MSDLPRGFCPGGATKSQARSHWCHLMDKTIESKIALSLASLWPNDRNGLNSLLGIVDSASVQEDRSQKHNLACRVLWNYCLGNSLLGICIYFCECVWERKRERGTTQVFWGRQAIDLLDSQGSSRVRNHLSGSLTCQASSFPLWIAEGLDWPQGP